MHNPKEMKLFITSWFLLVYFDGGEVDLHQNSKQKLVKFKNGNQTSLKYGDRRVVKSNEIKNLSFVEPQEIAKNHNQMIAGG